ncbi:hypothetical protein WA026_018473, partial [Henosepilachna vigintioctopunctata]
MAPTKSGIVHFHRKLFSLPPLCTYIDRGPFPSSLIPSSVLVACVKVDVGDVSLTRTRTFAPLARGNASDLDLSSSDWVSMSTTPLDPVLFQATREPSCCVFPFSGAAAPL